jgi:glucose/arabinose dehydrogenase
MHASSPALTRRLGLTLGVSLIATLFLLSARATQGQPAAYQVFLPTALRPFDAVGLEPFAEGLELPVGITHAGDGRLFVIERGGWVRIVYANGFLEPEPFLDLSDVVETGFWEQGLLGLAFHPDYAANGRFYVFYSIKDTADPVAPSRLSRFQVDPTNPNRALRDSETVLLTIPQPDVEHNGGDLHFGPDGYLYVAVGEGDRAANAQDVTNVLGGILRLDVDHGGPEPYAIPADNPFLDDPTAAPELWVMGLRNPWRMSFNDAGDLYIGDVGSSLWEEINIVPAGSGGGQNFGWSCREGMEDRPNGLPCVPGDVLTDPVFIYAHDKGRCSIIGGAQYEGAAVPAMRGIYFFSDLCEGTVWGMQTADPARPVRELGTFPGLSATAFGEDVNGELYVASYFPGKIYRLVAGE